MKLSPTGYAKIVTQMAVKDSKMPPGSRPIHATHPFAGWEVGLGEPFDNEFLPITPALQIKLLTSVTAR